MICNLGIGIGIGQWFLVSILQIAAPISTDIVGLV